MTYDILAAVMKSQFRPNGAPIITSNIPNDAEILRVIDGSAGWHSDPLAYRPVFRVIMCSDEWPEVPEGAYAPQFTPQFTAHKDVYAAMKEER